MEPSVSTSISSQVLVVSAAMECESEGSVRTEGFVAGVGVVLLGGMQAVVVGVVVSGGCVGSCGTATIRMVPRASSMTPTSCSPGPGTGTAESARESRSPAMGVWTLRRAAMWVGAGLRGAGERGAGAWRRAEVGGLLT